MRLIGNYIKILQEWTKSFLSNIDSLLFAVFIAVIVYGTISRALQHAALHRDVSDVPYMM
jgi:hypothetical protein